MSTRTQQQRSEVANTPPPDNSLLPGQLYVELADPMRIWAGVPTALAANQKKLLFDAGTASQALNKTGDTATGLITFDAGINVVGTPCTVPLSAPDSNNSNAASTAYVQGQASVALPLMNGTAVAGTSARWAHGDHVHPTDTSRAPLANANLTGAPTSPTPPVDNNTTRIATTAFVIGQASSVVPLVNGTAAIGVSTRYARADHVHPTDLSRAVITVGDSPPASPQAGNMWWDSTGAQLYIYYTDPTSSQWVVAINQNGAVTEAPTDGQVYGRGSSTWTPVLTLAQADARYMTPAQANAAYLPLTGGTLTGSLVVRGATTTLNPSGTDDPLWITADNGHYARTQYTVTNTRRWSIGVPPGGNFWIADETASRIVQSLDTSGNASFNGQIYSNPPAAGDAFQSTVPNGYNNRIFLAVSGTRQWSVGVRYDGTFAIGDESAGRADIYIDTSGNVSFAATIGAGAGNFTGDVTCPYITVNGGAHITSDTTVDGRLYVGNGVSSGLGVLSGTNFVSIDYNGGQQSPYLQYWVNGGGGGNIITTFADSNMSLVNCMGLNGSSAEMWAWYDGSGSIVSWPINWSDRKLKANLVPATIDALGTLQQLTVYSCDFQSPLPDATPQHWDCALIADEVGPLIPPAFMAAPEGASGYESINSLPLVCVMVKAIQQLAEQVAAMQEARA